MIPSIENYEDEDEQEMDFDLKSEPSFTYAMKIPGDEVTESRFTVSYTHLTLPTIGG